MKSFKTKAGSSPSGFLSLLPFPSCWVPFSDGVRVCHAPSPGSVQPEEPWHVPPLCRGLACGLDVDSPSVVLKSILPNPRCGFPPGCSCSLLSSRITLRSGDSVGRWALPWNWPSQVCRGLRICLSAEFTDDTVAAGPGSTLEKFCFRSLTPFVLNCT